MIATVGQLAEWVGGEVLGDADVPISDARAVADARPGDITLVGRAEGIRSWHTSQASAAVVPAVQGSAQTALHACGRPVIRAADPQTAFDQIARRLHHPPTVPPVVHPTARVHPSARLGAAATVGPFVVVGADTVIDAGAALHTGVVVGRGCRIGSGGVLHPGAVLTDGCAVGDRATVHAGAVLGADGFGYRTRGGRHTKVPHVGWVELGDDAVVGAVTTVDRGTYGPTRIGTGTELGSLVMVAHNCQIGEHNTLAAQSGVAGSSTIGDGVSIGPQAGVADHLRIGDGATLAARSGAVRDVPPGQRLAGFPARPEEDVASEHAAVQELPTLIADVEWITARLGLSHAQQE